MPNNFDKRPTALSLFICSSFRNAKKNFSHSMSHLTVDKMDKINFLLTEVSLECLGNKFFDIYGRQNRTLVGLVSSMTLKPPPRTVVDSESDLWKALNIEKDGPIIKKRICKIETPANERKRKRRASFSITNNETDTNNEANDPESLLVPMQNTPKAAKITQRRSTISVQLAKNRKPTIPLSTRTRNQARSQPRSIGPKPYSMKIAEVKQNLKKDINLRKLFE